MAEKRLDWFLARLGWGTRKEVKKMIKEGRVKVGGEPVTDPGFHIDPERDRVEVDGERLDYRPHLYILLNKPQGFVSATEDRFHPVVLELLPPQWRRRDLFPVGRLDRNAEGLLLLTTDGVLAHRLLSPKYRIPKTYQVLVRGRVEEVSRKKIEEGVLLEDGYRTLPGKMEILEAGERSLVELTLYEGKYHQVKRMMAALGHEVLYLKRTGLGPLKLEGLPLGEGRELEEKEIEALKRSVKLDGEV
ncbi:MAG TPA: rRNA pseudouridine synthase [Moorella mulderi]|nr:rRNA pseudouridine synthase [Moorella mulderi]